jgi:hypothetical protein
MDHVRFGINVELNIQSIHYFLECQRKKIQSYIFNKDNYFFRFFNKFIDNKRAIKTYIIRLRNYLFDD